MEKEGSVVKILKKLSQNDVLNGVIDFSNSSDELSKKI